ncbi:hypothetical protein [Paenibacillus sp. O199]|uniref:hypothetical protein n=1 Tax=Paenibacillus sp. O199 TaxID=1643925 RepID=UPI0007BF5C4D|nr:hypothetical protein [Paenibacillus sp. O199]
MDTNKTLTSIRKILKEEGVKATVTAENDGRGGVNIEILLSDKKDDRLNNKATARLKELLPNFYFQGAM